MSFSDCGVHPNIVKSLKALDITEPFPIQAITLPDAIGARDVLGRGATGSGKTLAFGLAMLTRLAGRPAQRRQPHGLILVPTRELAMQVHDSLSIHAKSVDLRMRLIAGGMPYKKQTDALHKGVHILVATPGRLMDLIKRGDADLSQVSITVLDEADQMADMGFLPSVKEILEMTKPNGQRLLFSATLDRGVDVLVKTFLRNPVEHATAPSKASVTTMEHHVLLVHPLDKDEVGAQIASRDGRTIFFVKTQRGADKLAEKFMSQGIRVGALHGGKTQSARTKTLKAFRDGLTPTLVATDVAARGIHVDDISLVVHFDAPADHKDYLHRSGRTARAGATGVSVLLANPNHQREIKKLTDRSGINPKVTRVRPSSKELIATTGAQEPTGVPWQPAVEHVHTKPGHAKPKHNRHKRDDHKRPRQHKGHKRAKRSRA